MEKTSEVVSVLKPVSLRYKEIDPLSGILGGKRVAPRDNRDQSSAVSWPDGKIIDVCGLLARNFACLLRSNPAVPDLWRRLLVYVPSKAVCVRQAVRRGPSLRPRPSVLRLPSNILL